MKCPYLRESWVKFCQAAPYKKVIEQTADSSADLCTSSAFRGCAAFRERRGSAPVPPCPFLQESRAQVCAQDPTVRLVPCTGSVSSRCVTENHRYCEIYLAALHRTLPVEAAGTRLPGHLPGGFFVARNHMWLEVSPEHSCHIGLDALLIRLLGRVEKLSFVTPQGEQCPSVLVTVQGVNVHLVFPNPMQITSPNVQARVAPEKILLDPYGSGWLFEGTETAGADIRQGLLSGEAAGQWMDREIRRVAEMMSRLLPTQGRKSESLAADGGVFVVGAIKHLRRNLILQFFDELFKNEEAL